MNKQLKIKMFFLRLYFWVKNTIYKKIVNNN